MFDQFPSSSGLPLWPDKAETKNEFTYYLTCGFGLIYVMCLGLAYASSRSKSSIIIVPPNEDVEDENSLHKYLLVLTTSLAPGSSCSSHAKVFLQMIGQNVKSKYYNIKVFTSDRFLLQRGNKDILLMRTKDYLGPIQEVKVVMSGLKTVTWRPNSVSVTCMTTGETYTVNCRLIDVNKTASEFEGGHVFPSSDNRRFGSCHAILRKIITFHPWLSPFNVSIRFGKFTPVVSTNIVFLALIALMTLTLVGYILTSDKDADNFSVEIECIIMAIIVVVAVDLIMYLLNVMFRNVKSGNQEIINKLFPKSDMTVHHLFDGEKNNEEQGKMFSFKKPEVCVSITEQESFVQDETFGKQMSDTHFQSFYSIDLLQSKQRESYKPDEYLPGPHQSHGEQEDVSNVRVKGSNKDMNWDQNAFESCSGFEVCHLEGVSHGESTSSDVGKLHFDVKTSLAGLEKFRDTGEDSNNSAGKDGQNTRKKDDKIGKHGMQSSTEEKKKCAQEGNNDDQGPTQELGAVGNVQAPKSVFSAEKFDEFRLLSATSEEFKDLESEADSFLDVADSAFQIDKNEPLHFKSSLDKLKTEKYTTFSKESECTGSSSSKSSEDDFHEDVVSKTVHHNYKCGKVQNPEAQRESTTYCSDKRLEEQSSTFKASLLDARETFISCDQVNIQMQSTESEDNEEHFFDMENKASDMENKASDEQFYSRHSDTVKDEPIGLHSVLLSGRKACVTFSESDKIQQQVEERLTQLQKRANRFSKQLLLQFCESRRLLLTDAHSSVLDKTKVAAQTWLTNVIEEQVLSVLHTNSILETPKDPLAVERTTLSGQVVNWPLSQTLGAECVQHCIQAVCEAMALPRHPDFKHILVSEIEAILKQHLHQFTQQFYDQHRQISKSIDLWTTVSTEERNYNLAQPSLYVSQSSPLFQSQESVNFPTPVGSKSTEYEDMHLKDLSSFFIECVQEYVLKEEGDNFSVTVMPRSTCSTEDEDEVHMLLGPPDTAPERSRSFMELPIEFQLCRSAIERAMKELWTEYQDPISVYTIFLMQAVTLDKLKVVITGRDSQEQLGDDQKNFEDLDVKEKELDKFENQIENQSVEDRVITYGFRSTPSQKLAKFASGLSRKISLMKESKANLIPLLLKKSDTNKLSSMGKTDQLHPLIPCLNKKWHQLGFHLSVNANKNLAQALTIKLLKDWKEEPKKSVESTKTLVLDNVSCIYRIEKELNDSLAKYATACFEKWCPYMQCLVANCGADTEKATDQVFAVVDVASQEMIASLESIAKDAFNSEIAKTIATLTFQDSTLQGSHNADGPQMPVTDDNDDNKTVTSYEMNLMELIQDFLPLRAYLTFVTNSEKLLSKKHLKANYLNRYQRKHNKFAAITFQHVLDSYYDKDPEMLDTTLTNNTLQQLEWHVLHENTKMIPNVIGRIATFVLFCLTVFGLVYVSLIGGSLTVIQVQEWMSYFFISVAIYGFVLEPFVAIIGYQDS